MTNLLLLQIVKALTCEPRFSEFKFRKRDSSLIRKISGGFEIIELQNWAEQDIVSGKKALTIKPLYLKRFDILHQWFEPFSFKSLRDQRDNYSIGFDGAMLKKKNQFFFLLNEEDLEKDIDNFKDVVIDASETVFNKFSNLVDLYDYLIPPLLDKKKCPPNIGADWIFEYLSLTKIVNPSVYDGVKSIVLRQVEEMNNKGEPNVLEYYQRMDEILHHLECFGLNLT